MGLRVILVEPEGEINIGFVARVMKNFGFKELVLVNPKVSIEDALPYASHGDDILRSAIICGSVDEAIKGYSLVVATSSKVSVGEDLLRIPVTIKDFARKVAELKDENVAILFGRESVGLTREEIGKSHILVTIPASKDYPSLNLSHAVAIVLYEIFNAKAKSSQLGVIEQPKPKEMEVLLRNIERAVKALKMPAYRERKTEIVLKRVIGRAFISRHEAYVLSGFFRKVHLLLSGNKK
ncbi:MAG: RNA methyltransferase [Thermoprotei archaeon]|nr:RNA methyltransferase [Thermoprotei archaeon]